MSWWLRRSGVKGIRKQSGPGRGSRRKRPGGRHLRVESLETRDLLSVSVPGFAAPHHVLYRGPDGLGPLSTAGPTGYTPAEIRSAYGFDKVAWNGSGTTIAIVDAYDNPNIANDLHQFDQAFGLPDPTLTVVNQTGGSALPAANSQWATEIALDVQWAHAIAPGANILLVEANSDSLSDLLTAVDYARNAPGVVAVSMSWSVGEYSGETLDDSHFTTPAMHGGVTFLAASGDTGAPAGYPATSPNVVSVGGTTLNVTLNPDGTANYGSESGWSGSGGGISAVESQPTYQAGVVTQPTTYRTSPDVAYDADPATGFSVYDSYNNPASVPWSQLGGTSAAAPQWAGLIAIADQGRTAASLGTLDGPTQTLPGLYALRNSDFYDVTNGTSTGQPQYSAGPGYDLVTGLGSPRADLLIDGLLHQPPTALTISNNYVADKQPAGTLVGQLSATDADTGDTFTYSLVPGQGDKDNAAFTIVGDKLETAASLNFWTKPAYGIRVRATDQEGAILDKQFTIFVQFPVSLKLSPSAVNEGQPAGSAVGTFSATDGIDPREDDIYTYSLVSGIGGNDNGSFTISGNTLKTAATFDFAKKATYSILVRVTDQYGFWSDKPLTVGVNAVNHPPTAVRQTYTVLQDAQLDVAAPGVLTGVVDPEGVSPRAFLVAKSGPKHGTLVSFNPNGSFVYKPNQNYHGTDQFQYQAFDGTVYSSPATVTITVDAGPNIVVPSPTLAVGGNNLVLTRVQNNIRLVSFATREVLLDKPASAVTSLVVQGATGKPDTLTIDSSTTGPGVLPGGVTFDCGIGWPGGTLVLRGSPGADKFVVSSDSVTVNSLVVHFSNVKQVVLQGGTGNDTYQISGLRANTTIADGKGIDTLDFSGASSDVTLDLGKRGAQKVFATSKNTLTVNGAIDVVRGGSGKNTLRAGLASCVLVGGTGSNQLTGGKGRSVLIGGLGKSTLKAGSAGDLLIAGSTDYDQNSADLAAILAQWTSSRPAAARIKSLTDGIGQNGRVHLRKGDGVIDNHAADALYRGPGADWILSFDTDQVKRR